MVRRRFSIVLILGLIVAETAFFIFVFTFDANRYKGLLIDRIEKVIGKDVDIDSISLYFWQSLAIKINGLSIKDANKPILKADSIYTNIKLLPLIKKDIQIKGLYIKGIRLNATNSDMEFIAEGRLSFLDIYISLKELEGKDFLDTLKAKGIIELDTLVLNNINILRLALTKLNMVPGLVENLKNSLPEQYKQILIQNYTMFKPVDIVFDIRDRRLSFQNFTIKSDTFYLESKGFLGLKGDVKINSSLFIPQDLSTAFADCVSVLRYLEDTNGMITMPLDIEGTLSDISIKPDLDYVLKRLAVSKGH